MTCEGWTIARRGPVDKVPIDRYAEFHESLRLEVLSRAISLIKLEKSINIVYIKERGQRERFERRKEQLIPDQVPKAEVWPVGMLSCYK